MFDAGPSRSASHLVDHPAQLQLFHPKPVPFTRPAFTSSYSSPACSLLSSASASPPSPPPVMPMSSSTSCSPSPSSPHLPHSPHGKPSHTLSAKHSRTLSKNSTKKTSSTTTNKVKSVQVSLEVKVERSRGFHAFFVPLARSMPPAPPSSPVFGQSANSDHHGADSPPKASSEERWVEDVGQHMDIDA